MDIDPFSSAIGWCGAQKPWNSKAQWIIKNMLIMYVYIYITLHYYTYVYISDQLYPHMFHSLLSWPLPNSGGHLFSCEPCRRTLWRARARWCLTLDPICYIQGNECVISPKIADFSIHRGTMGNLWSTIKFWGSQISVGPKEKGYLGCILDTSWLLVNLKALT